MTTRTILIVDDEPQIRKILALMFKQKGWEVFEAEEGYQALELCSKTLPMVVLTDINMPLKENGDQGLGGLELVEELKNKYPDNIPKIFVMSGYVDNKQKIEQIKSVCSYFEKPAISKIYKDIDAMDLKLQT